MTTIALNLLAMLLPLAFIGLPFFYLFFKERLWSQAKSLSCARPPLSVRSVEVLVLGLLATVLILHIAAGGLGMVTTPTPDFLVRARLVLCGVMALIAAGWMLLGFRRSVSVAAAGIVYSTVAGTFALSATNALSASRFKNEILKIPLPIEISIVERIPDVDVVINGVNMGSAPLHTTMEEIDAKAPAIQVSEKEQGEGWKNFQSSTYLPQKKIELDRAQRVDIGHDYGRNDDKSKAELFVRFERKGKPLMVGGSLGWSGPSRMFGQIQPARLPFSVMAEQWDRDVTELLERARLNDYHATEEWRQAANTYAVFVRRAIQNAVPNEPQFQQVLNDWARLQYKLDQATDSDSAWKILDTIRQQADKAREYHTDSIAGDAVELLIDKLDPQQLVSATKTRLNHFLATGVTGIGRAWHTRHGRQYFSTHSDFAPSLNVPSDFVLAHAIWRLDQRLDVDGASAANLVESQIVPILLQLGYRDSTGRALASELGGSVFERFEWRRQRDVKHFRPASPMTPSEWIETEHVDKSFWEAVNNAGPAGAAFRHRHSDEVRELAQTLLSKSHLFGSSLPTWTNFLFLDVEGGKPLAREFWPKFKAMILGSGSVHEKTALQWAYLARLRPLPDVKEFVAAFPTDADAAMMFMNSEQALMQLPEDLRLRVAQACIEQAEKLEAELKNPDSRYAQIVFQLNRFISKIPTEPAVDATIKLLEGSDRKTSSIVGDLKHQATYAMMSPRLLARLATSPKAEYRGWVVPQIRQLPTAENRKILNRLVQDEDPTVRAAAEQVAKELDELRKRPLPRLD